MLGRGHWFTIYRRMLVRCGHWQTPIQTLGMATVTIEMSFGSLFRTGSSCFVAVMGSLRVPVSESGGSSSAMTMAG